MSKTFSWRVTTLEIDTHNDEGQTLVENLLKECIRTQTDSGKYSLENQNNTMFSKMNS